jgi:hypothetical protein
MESISLKRQVAIKAIVTDVFKQNVTAEIQQALQQIDLNLQQLEFQGKRAMADLEKKALSPAGPQQAAQMEALSQSIEQERDRLAQAKNEMLQRLQMISQLEMNSEFVQGTVDNYVDIKVGDNLYEKLSNTEVILKDGIVVEIRGEA